ncbi:MAG: hypothetical protein U9R75_04590 [Candidatus Thermoplasmatota archaeon]|nr:hypothetical protein [Candidatus Thermoplasmatota archaeon]
MKYGLDPDDASDAALDADRDSISNLDEFKQGSDPNVDDSVDTNDKGSMIVYLIIGIILLLIMILIVVSLNFQKRHK